MRATPFTDSTSRHTSISRRWSLLWLMAIAVAPLQAAEPVFQLKVVTDRQNAVYAAGEEARFVVTVTRDGQPATTGTVSYVATYEHIQPGNFGGHFAANTSSEACQEILTSGVFAELEKPVSAVCVLAENDGFDFSCREADAE